MQLPSGWEIDASPFTLRTTSLLQNCLGLAVQTGPLALRSQGVRGIPGPQKRGIFTPRTKTCPWGPWHSTPRTKTCPWGPRHCTPRTKTCPWGPRHSTPRTKTCPWGPRHCTPRTKTCPWGPRYTTPRTKTCPWGPWHTTPRTKTCPWGPGTPPHGRRPVRGDPGTPPHGRRPVRGDPGTWVTRPLGVDLEVHATAGLETGATLSCTINRRYSVMHDKPALLCHAR